MPGSAGSNATYDAASNTLSWPLGILAFNSRGTVSFQAQIASTVSVGSSVSNQATLSCAELPVPVASNPAAFIVGAAPAGWWMFHHDAQHSGRSTCNGPSLPRRKWKYATGNMVTSSPAIAADGTIYVGSWDGNLYALNPANGSLKWQYATGNSILSSPAVGPDGTIYLGTEVNRFDALNPAGTLKWQFTTAGGIPNSPTIDGNGIIYIASDDGYLYALNPADGSLRWKAATGSTNNSPAIGPDGTIYIGSLSDNVYALNPADGSLQWQYATGNMILASPGRPGRHRLYRLNGS